MRWKIFRLSLIAFMIAEMAAKIEVGRNMLQKACWLIDQGIFDPKAISIAKLFAGITIAYALSPLDLIPDFIPVLGYLDDLILLPALVALTIRFIPKPVWEKNLALAVSLWENEKPKKWYYAIPIVLFWLLLLWVIVKAVWF